MAESGKPDGADEDNIIRDVPFGQRPPKERPDERSAEEREDEARRAESLFDYLAEARRKARER